MDSIKDFPNLETASKKLLRSLETANYLYTHLNKLDQAKKAASKDDASKTAENKEKETKEQEGTKSEDSNFSIQNSPNFEKQVKMVDELRSLWGQLSDCLTQLEKMPDSHHAILALQNAAEAFFLCYSMFFPQSPKSTSTKEQTATNSTVDNLQSLTQPQSTSINSPDSQPSSTVNLNDANSYQKEMFAFAEKHRSVLNQILRGNNQSLESNAFAILTHFPKLLDFDVKRKYFHKELKKVGSRDRNRYRAEDIAIRVRRSHIFGDSFRELHRLRNSDWRSRFYIMFEGEEGQDAGGLLREWYQVITREIFNPNYALFINAPGDRVTYMINKSSYVNPEHLDYFKFVGRLIAKAIYDNKQLDCYFTRAFYKHILNIHVKYQDIESEDPEIFKSLEFLLNNSIEALGYDLMFCVEVEEFGVRSSRQLKDNGSKLLVTDANKQEYVHLMCQMKMTGSIRQQLNAFLEGFYELIPRNLISIFNEQELELLISGLPEIDVDDLCVNTEYKNYTRTSQQIQWFWRALRSFDQEDKAKFLQFVTGTSKVPLQGFAHLEGMNGTQKFTIQKDTRSQDRLPSAHTCFNQLDLPEYPNYETLQKMLLLACRECSEGFAFA
uniref:HECT-type E3 ubiquitin transferase n=1 Tax=Meloidogyne incognita TaxID=6306 RepID=A0A914KKJ5_MELIC